MNAIILSENAFDLKRVYPTTQIKKICQQYDCDGNFYCKKDILTQDFTSTEIVFSTWGMPNFTKDELVKFLPDLKYVFYAAGSVQGFAETLLEKGIRVFSSWKANAVPVAEYTFAQIVLATKGYFANARRTTLFSKGASNLFKYKGNYHSKIGLLGVGGIGTLVAEKLKALDVDVYAFDPYLSKEKAQELNIKIKDINWIFANCDVVSNHLANKRQLSNIINYKLLKSMPKYSTFINTGRGAQLDEKALAKALRKDKTKFALLDVTKKEPLQIFNPLRFVKNKIVTSHIAGSIGQEVERMSEHMINISGKAIKGEVVDCEVFAEMLATMA